MDRARDRRRCPRHRPASPPSRTSGILVNNPRCGRRARRRGSRRTQARWHPSAPQAQSGRRASRARYLCLRGRDSQRAAPASGRLRADWPAGPVVRGPPAPQTGSQPKPLQDKCSVSIRRFLPYQWYDAFHRPFSDRPNTETPCSDFAPFFWRKGGKPHTQFGPAQ